MAGIEPTSIETKFNLTPLGDDLEARIVRLEAVAELMLRVFDYGHDDTDPSYEVPVPSPEIVVELLNQFRGQDKQEPIYDDFDSNY